MSEELKQLEELLANDRKIIEENYKEIERLNSIIKEVREYIEKASYLQGNKILEEKEFLKILDKEVN